MGSGNLLIAENGATYIFPPEICEVDGHHLRQGDDVPHWVDPATVGQFTGEFDDLGVEIYEDDLVEYPECVDLEEYEWGAPSRPRPIIMRTRHQVKFIDGCFWLMPATDGGDVLWQLAGLCHVMGWDLEQIAQENRAKLRDRQQRNVIVGDGDNR